MAIGEREQLQLKAFWFVDATPSLLLFQGASLLQAELQRKTGFSRQLHMTSLRYLMQSMHITGLHVTLPGSRPAVPSWTLP